MKNVPHPIRVVRQLRGLSQTELAVAANHSQAWICRVERGCVQPTRDELDRLIEILAADRRVLDPAYLGSMIDGFFRGSPDAPQGIRSPARCERDRPKPSPDADRS